MPIANKTADSHLDCRVLAQGAEIGASWIKRGDTSDKKICQPVVCCSRFGSKKLYAYLGKAAGQDDDWLYAVTWNLVY